MERKLTKKEHIFNFLRKLFFLTLGPFIAALALEVFLVPNNIIDGGIVGISIILSYLTKSAKNSLFKHFTQSACFRCG